MREARLVISLFAILLVAGCTIGPRQSAVTTPIRNGQIVLLRKGSRNYGAFIPTSQHMVPEKLEFRWYYRTDGKGTFKPNEAAHFESGTGGCGSDSSVPYSDTITIINVAQFGPFSLGWSGIDDRQGYIYYGDFEHEAVSPNDELICVTEETDITRIDATSPRWVYKGSPTDPGIRANGQRACGVR